MGIVDAAMVENVVINTHYLPEMLNAHFLNRSVTLSHEAEILETGGGLRNALPLLGSDPVFTFNSDAVWTGQNPLTALANNWDPDRMDALLMLVDPAHAHGYNGNRDFDLSKSGRIKRGTELVYTGAQIIKTDALADIEEDRFSLNRLWDMMIAKDRIFGTIHTGGWCDVGTPAGIKVAEQLLEHADV